MAATYTPIASITLGAAASSATFTNIPSGYTDLVLISNPINTTTTAINIYLNSDTGTNYSCTRIFGEGANVYSDKFSNTSSSLGGWGTNTNTNPFIFISHFNNYSNTTTNKTFLTKIAEINAGYSGLVSTLWRSTSAITTIQFSGNANFGVNSRFDLYGILGANA